MLFSHLPGWSIAGLFSWLGAMSFVDARTHAVPHYGCTVPMLLAGVLRVFWPPNSVWLSSLAGALLLVAVVLSDHVWLAAALIGVSAILAGVSGLQTLTISGGWTLALLGTWGGLWGGGDAKIAMTLLAICPDWQLGAFLLGGLAVGSGVTLVLKYRAVLPLVMLNTLRELRQGHFPTGADGADGYTRIPGVPWLTLGAAAYVLRGLL